MKTKINDFFSERISLDLAEDLKNEYEDITLDHLNYMNEFKRQNKIGLCSNDNDYQFLRSEAYV